MTATSQRSFLDALTRAQKKAEAVAANEWAGWEDVANSVTERAELEDVMRTDMVMSVLSGLPPGVDTEVDGIWEALDQRGVSQLACVDALRVVVNDKTTGSGVRLRAVGHLIRETSYGWRDGNAEAQALRFAVDAVIQGVPLVEREVGAEGGGWMPRRWRRSNLCSTRSRRA